ncbi:hypothetical protein BJ508DRAFT_336260 [Ascobolus immersus RN42]|uniref:Chromo domain-containing protein n=1 Tax=Ascobolus immersus RN42 TaxID=1160509 RepID=A0A3N4H9A4_ASCIM|nr:hypothetical protein BJ508DRAFT_336260 [Ascobolus immersus RN42]
MFLSKELTGPEHRYWPTHLEMAGLVWAVKKTLFVLDTCDQIVEYITDHQPNASIAAMRIIVGDDSTTTFTRVNINPEIQQEHKDTLYRAVHEFQVLFNEVPGIVREPKEDWLKVSVDPEDEKRVRQKPPYPLSATSKTTVDRVFDANRKYGRMSDCPDSPYSLQVFVAAKDRPVVDMRPLNAMVPGDVISVTNLIPAPDPYEDPYDRSPKPPGPITEGHYEIDRLVSKRTSGRYKKIQYLVRYRGYGPLDDQWHNVEDLEHSAPEMVQAYEEDLKRRGLDTPD